MNPTGIEAQVCADIAARQARGIAKYGTTVADNPLTLNEWLQHAYEEALDMAIYLKRAMAGPRAVASQPSPVEQYDRYNPTVASLRDDGMPGDPDERRLRRLLAVRVAMQGAYYDDGEAQGQEHGINIDFMRDPVAVIDSKLRELNLARGKALAAAEPDHELVNDQLCGLLQHGHAVVRAVAGFVFGVAFTCVVSWLAGYNFDTRGGEAVVTFIFSVMLGAVSAFLTIVNPWSVNQ